MGFILRDAYGRQVVVGAMLRIGSDPANQIMLQEPSVMPFHATLSEQQGTLLLRDENSISGTYVNRNRIQGIVSLRVGDQVSIGNSIFIVDNPSVQQVVPAASPSVASYKKRTGGCWIGGVMGILILMIACIALVGGGGYYLYSSNPAVQKIITDFANLPTAVPELDENGNPIGPEILDTTDPALNTTFSHSFQHYQEDSIDGYDQNDAPFTKLVIWEVSQQDQPEWSSYQHHLEKINDETIDESESTVLNGMAYGTSLKANGKCSVGKDKFADKRVLDDWPGQLKQNLKGSLKRVEMGETVNGVVTDRYELKLGDVGTSSAIELKSGSLYRAREGGYLVRFEFTILIKPQSYGMNVGSRYSTDKPALLTFHHDFTYFPDGTMTVKVPAVCAGEVQPGQVIP